MESYIEYTIVKGDNLTKIAKAHNTTVDALVELNNIKDKNLIYAGDTLKIPVEITDKKELVEAKLEEAKKAAEEAEAAVKAAEAEVKEVKKEAGEGSVLDKISDAVTGLFKKN